MHAGAIGGQREVQLQVHRRGRARPGLRREQRGEPECFASALEKSRKASLAVTKGDPRSLSLSIRESSKLIF